MTIKIRFASDILPARSFGHRINGMVKTVYSKMWHLVFCFPISFVVINLVYVKEKKENWPILSKWKQK